MINPLLAAAIGSVLRFVLAAAFGFLVQRGIWSEAEAALYLSAAVAGLLGLGWSLYQKYSSRLKLLTALAKPPATSEEQVEKMVAQGQAPPASLAKDEKPVLNTDL